MATTIHEEIAKELTLSLVGKVSLNLAPDKAANEVSNMYKIILKAVEESTDSI